LFLDLIPRIVILFNSSRVIFPFAYFFKLFFVLIDTVRPSAFTDPIADAAAFCLLRTCAFVINNKYIPSFNYLQKTLPRYKVVFLLISNNYGISYMCYLATHNRDH